MKNIGNSARYVFENNKANIELTHHYFSMWAVAEEVSQCFNGMEEEKIRELKKSLKSEFTKLKNSTTWENYPLSCSLALVKDKFQFVRG